VTTVRYCTPEWLEASATGYRADPSFKQKFAKLTTKLSFRVKANPAWGMDDDIVFAGYVNKGDLDKLAFVDEEEAERESDFILSATPQEWKRILRKESKFVTDFMVGRITLEKGSTVGVVQIAPHSDTFVAALTQVDLQFQDEMTAEEVEDYRAYRAEFRQELGV
jgi:hypothetical protein